MGGNVSREVSISDEKSGTMSNSFSWSGTFPRGVSLEGNLSTKLTKFKKFEVTPKKKSSESQNTTVDEEDKVDDTSDKEFIESLLLNVLENALDSVGKRGMTKSSTLPANMKGLGVSRTQSFGKRIRKSIRKLVVKTPKKDKKEDGQGSSEDIVEALLVEVLSDVTGCPEECIENLERAELAETVLEESIVEENELIDEAVDEISEMNISKSSTLPANFKGLGQNTSGSFGKRIRKSLRKFVTPKKNRSGIFGHKESVEIAETILDEIVDNIGEDKASNEESKAAPDSDDTIASSKALEVVNEVNDEVVNTDQDTHKE